MAQLRWTPVLGTVAAVLAPPLLVGPTLAQEEAPERAPRAEVGSRVRVTTDEAEGTVVGWIEARDGSGLRLVRASDHAVVPIPTSGIRRLEVSETRRSVSRQMAPGMVAGGLAGLALGVALTEEHSCRPNALFCFDYGSEKLLAGLAGAGLGMLAGGLVSWAIVPAESWRAVPPPGLALAAGPRGAVVALTLPLP